MSDLLKFLDKIEGAGYGGTAEFEIARTEARDLREALKPFVEWLHHLEDRHPNFSHWDIEDVVTIHVKWGELRAARDASLLANPANEVDSPELTDDELARMKPAREVLERGLLEALIEGSPRNG